MSEELWGCPCCGHAGNESAEIDKLTQKVKDLEFSLDDRDCYIADADMKNEDLVKQVAELRAALARQATALDGAMSQLGRPCNSINDISFIAFVGIVEAEVIKTLKESE